MFPRRAPGVDVGFIFALILGRIFDRFLVQKGTTIYTARASRAYHFSLLFRRVATRPPKRRFLLILEGFGMRFYGFLMHFDLFLAVFWYGFG